MTAAKGREAIPHIARMLKEIDVLGSMPSNIGAPSLYN